MNQRTIKALVLSIFCVWSMQPIAQDTVNESADDSPGIELVDPPTEVEPPSIPQRLIWAWATLLGSGDPYTRIPLYGYPVSALPEDVTLEALSVAAEGNVHIALLRPRDSQAGQDDTGMTYTGQGVRLAGNWNDSEDQETLSRRREILQNFLQSNNINESDAVLAFTRPLAAEAFAAGTNGSPEIREFVTSSSLWEFDSGEAGVATQERMVFSNSR